MCVYLCSCMHIYIIRIYIYVCMYVQMKEIHQQVNSGYFWMVAFSKFPMISQITFISSNNNNKDLIDAIFKARTQLLDDC